jgi:uncharacterized protein YdeI (YjbR/CyaY-like superfamily)
MITEIEDFFDRGCGRCERFDTDDCSVRQWEAGLRALRRICLDAGLTEHVKWGHPCYMHAGRNIALIGALRGDFRLSFFNAALMTDPDGLLERQGPNTRHPDCIRFTTVEQVAEREPALRRYLAEAMAYADAGTCAPRDMGEIDLPDEMIEALDADPELAEAFAALTPGRRNSYAVNLNSARQPATRIARIAKFRDRILAGKGATER